MGPVRFAVGGGVFARNSASVATIFSLAFVVAMAASSYAEDAAKSQDALPRYSFKAGQELHYTGESTFKYDKGTIDHVSDYTIWITRKNDDGSWRIIARLLQGDTAKELESENARATFAYLDLFPDGRLVENASLGFNFEPRPLFPQLPANEAELKTGWKSPSDTTETSYNYTAASADSSATDFQFHCVTESPIDKIYLATHESDFTFDRAKRLVQDTHTKTTQGWGFNGSGTSQLALKDSIERPQDWVAAFDRDMNQYLETGQVVDKLLEHLELAKNPEAKVDEAKALWTKLRGDLTNEIVQQTVDHRVKLFDTERKYYLENAKEMADVINKPAAAWDATDLDGHPHRLADYAGKIVVLDFWYRGCGWCMRSMPQVNQLAADFAGEPVVVLGMNTDSKLEDAKFVVDAMQIKYPIMHIDEELPKKYGVSGFPTILVLDQSGTIRHIHDGYTPTLREELSASIRELLNKKNDGQP